MSDPYSAFRSSVDPSRAQASDNLTEAGWRPYGMGATVPGYAGIPVNAESMMTSATVFACTRANSETVAGLPGIVYRMKGEKHIRDDEGDPYYLLQEEPNGEMDPFTFWELAVTRLLNRGNFYAEIQRDAADRPIGLWPIHNSRVEPTRTADGELLYLIHHNYTNSAEYADPEWRRNNLTYLTPRNMLNIVGFGSANGVISPGVLPCAQEISLDMATLRYGARFFGRGATPVGVVEHPNYIADDAKRANFRRDMNTVHSNLENPHQIAVLWDGAVYKQVSIAPEQAQFLETRRYTAEQICKFYLTPPAIVGDFTDSKYATADATIRQWVMVTLRNLATRIEGAIHRQVFRTTSSDSRKRVSAFPSKHFYEICLKGLLRGDPLTQAQTNQILRQNGVLSANEWRGELEYDPIDGPEGDYRIVPGGYARLDRIDDQGTRSGTASSGSGSAGGAGATAWRKDVLIDALERGIDRPAQAQGFDPSAAITEAANVVATEAIGRIHAITTQQLSRWGAREISAEEKTAFWEKQRCRLLDALRVMDNLLSKAGIDSRSAEIADAVIAQYSSGDPANLDIGAIL